MHVLRGVGEWGNGQDRTGKDRTGHTSTHPLKELPSLSTPHHGRVVAVQALTHQRVASSGGDEGEGGLGTVACFSSQS